MVVGPDLAAIRSWRELSGKRFEAEYGADAIAITTTEADGKSTSKTLKPPVAAVDNDVSLQIQPALPLAAGYATGYTDVIPTTGSLAPVRLTVTGAETITVPAGTFPRGGVEMDFGSGKHDAWYGQEAPHPLVKCVNRGSGAAFVLRALGTGQPASAAPATAASAVGATPAPTQAAAAVPAGPPPIKIPLLLSSFLIQLPLMIVFPIVLGWWIRRRYGVGWGIFWAGALTFVASQVVHLPLNLRARAAGRRDAASLWPLPLMALVAGLSAGVCEEGARWITLRFFLKRARLAARLAVRRRARRRRGDHLRAAGGHQSADDACLEQRESRGARPACCRGRSDQRCLGHVLAHRVVSAHPRRRRAPVRHHHPDCAGRGGDALVHTSKHHVSVRRHRPAHAGGFLGRLGHGDTGDDLG